MIFSLALGSAVVTALMVLNVSVGVRSLRRLERLEPWDGSLGHAPSVSIVIAARNEERGIEAGLSSLLRQNYLNLEIVVVDDRSTDRTGEIAARLARADRRITLVRIDELPSGWLGKNHASWVGARSARGDWLLFTDADVVMAPDTVGRVLQHAEQAGRDHVSLLPSLVVPTVLLQAFMPVFGFFLVSWLEPWRAPNPKSKRFMGVGAFNLVRRSAYQLAGTHQRIALRPDDDLKLGKILKQSGARQELILGGGMVSVEWYHSLGELIRGLEKNAFSGLEYSVPMALGGVAALLVLVLGPIVGALFAPAPASWLFLGAVLAMTAGMIDATAGPVVPWSRGLLYPIAVLLFTFIVMRTMIKNLADGGITWRDTFYSLDELRGNRV
jgi:glycosyltransferase involved in cell wall biosynthesis